MVSKQQLLSDGSRAARVTSLVLAILFAVFGKLAFYLPGLDASTANSISGMSEKMAIVLVLMWLAWPQMAKLRRMPGGKVAMIAIGLVGVAIIIQPRTLKLLGPILLAGVGVLMTLLWIQRSLTPPRR